MIPRVLIVAGLSLAGLGLIWPLLGHMPGDFVFGRGSVRIFVPLGSSLLVSVYLSVILTVAFWFLSR
ncbi:MAG: DUF2905 domain-containing protein [Rhodospirillales bacterium]|nr:DUF2905 domain-containing protein [Rhodospirillales bacterium]